MEIETVNTDLWPFPSLIFALMYILLNSPRPLVRIVLILVTPFKNAI